MSERDKALDLAELVEMGGALAANDSRELREHRLKLLRSLLKDSRLTPEARPLVEALLRIYQRAQA